MTERNLAEEAKAARGLEQGKLVIVRPSKLAIEGGTSGLPAGRVAGTVVVAEGTFEEAKPNKYNTAKKDYFIRGDDGTLYIINGTQSLEEQMDLIAAGEGTKVAIEYGGKKLLKSGRSVHEFTVFVK